MRIGIQLHKRQDFREAAWFFRLAHEIDRADSKNMWNELTCLTSMAPVPLPRVVQLAEQYVALASGDEAQRGCVAEARRLAVLGRPEVEAHREKYFHGAFVSYAHQAFDLVMAVVRASLSEGPATLRFFMDQSSLTCGRPWREGLERAITSLVDAFVIFHDGAAAASTHVAIEADMAFDQLPSPEGTRIIVVDIGGTYVRRRDELVVPFLSPAQVYLELKRHICRLPQRSLVPWPERLLPNGSVDIVGLPGDRRVAAAIQQAMESCGIVVVHDTTTDDRLEAVRTNTMPADVAVLLVTRAATHDAAWREVAEHLFDPKPPDARPRLLPVLLDGTEPLEPWAKLHCLDYRRFADLRNLLWQLVAQVKGLDVVEIDPETLPHLPDVPPPRQLPPPAVPRLIVADLYARLSPVRIVSMSRGEWLENSRPWSDTDPDLAMAVHAGELWVPPGESAPDSIRGRLEARYDRDSDNPLAALNLATYFASNSRGSLAAWLCEEVEAHPCASSVVKQLAEILRNGAAADSRSNVEPWVAGSAYASLSEAMSRMRAGDVAGACRGLRAAINADPALWLAHRELSGILLEQGPLFDPGTALLRAQDAVELLETQVLLGEHRQYKKELVKVFINSGLALLHLHRPGDACVQLQAALLLDPANEPVQRQITMILRAARGRIAFAQRPPYERGRSLRDKARESLLAT